ncbi:hypothetical protein A2866_06375 [Candidatus Roizmanbacteria bacterium RIFCSPHIGHO2_01_FULL_39_8]|uniref:Four helix bundle protein n=2 Tax=Candidatus Roizmaniibacteriota TaxID=1752723 RepID=A0A1F7GMP4_9BACT|nr:MAG: hypothetical protein A2866_06375 [Candidatus Roizmanbacteria bacterium RIFCSPHIGHO2_01_FULL_39_8]OGK26400.1 MAG: hypothetical protein A3C28_00350 [Candidatus Roizmanbacteria bacterium RIFCSPHIGHO2_02_FULL_39_9]
MPTKKFDLEDRTLNLSIEIIRLCKKLPKTTIVIPLINQIMRSGTAIGANYTEANDSLGKKDFILRVRTARKEAKETIYWLKLVKEAENNFSEEIIQLLQECTELKNILSSIINNASYKFHLYN